MFSKFSKYENVFTYSESIPLINRLSKDSLFQKSSKKPNTGFWARWKFGKPNLNSRVSIVDLLSFLLLSAAYIENRLARFFKKKKSQKNIFHFQVLIQDLFRNLIWFTNITIQSYPWSRIGYCKESGKYK